MALSNLSRSDDSPPEFLSVDWIFSKNISGLITKFGGAASHMAIRCAELGIPAAIGCGEQLFESLQQANRVLLDCSSKLIIPIQ